MKRKLMSLLLVGAMTATMFAGCGGSSNEPAADNADNAADDAAADDAADDATLSNCPVTLRHFIATPI